jgi:ASC-1-like (ASCH) protein
LKNQARLDSLKMLAGQFQKHAEATGTVNDEVDATAQEFSKRVLVNDPLPALPPPPEEEILDFPVLKKHKTYSVGVIKPQLRQFPAREKVIKSKISPLVIKLKDYEVFEAVVTQRELQPFVLKNSHAVIEGLDSCDKVTFKMDSLGNSVATVEASSKKEKLTLGCIIRYEMARTNAPALIVSSRDLEGDAAVIGGPCEIEFLVEDKSSPKYEKASLKSISEADGRVEKMNQEAGHSISWIL